MDSDRFKTKRIEEAITQIEAKVTNAMELSQKAKVCAERSEALLVCAHQDLETLYLTLDEQESSRE